MKEFVDNLGAQEQALLFALLFIVGALLSIRGFHRWREFRDTRLLIIAISLAGMAACMLFMVFHLLINA